VSEFRACEAKAWIAVVDWSDALSCVTAKFTAKITTPKVAMRIVIGMIFLLTVQVLVQLCRMQGSKSIVDGRALKGIRVAVVFRGTTSEAYEISRQCVLQPPV
jgi:hypothetical protein